jgi:Zn-dependent protease
VSLFAIVQVVLLIPSITFHEFMHGWAAYQLGDPTAKNAGRLTMNPVKSIDPFGSILLPLMGLFFGGVIFGYAKPVPYNPMYFKNLRQGEVIVGFAGPAANLSLGLFGVALCWLGVALPASWSSLASAIILIGLAGASINFVLMFFNLIPIPPLDGSSVVPIFLPDRMLRDWYGLQRYAFAILIVLVIGLPTIARLAGLPGVNPIGWYLSHTAYALLGLLLPPSLT